MKLYFTGVHKRGTSARQRVQGVPSQHLQQGQQSQQGRAQLARQYIKGEAEGTREIGERTYATSHGM